MPQYAQIADLQNYIAPAALQSLTAGQQNAALQSASDTADGYLRSQFTLPLSNWTNDLTKYVCFIAKGELMAGRGYNPESGDDVFARDKAEAIRWLEGVATGKITPGVVDSSPAAAPGVTSATGPKVFSARSRGFDRDRARSSSWGDPF